MQDIATLTGGQVIAPEVGLKLDQVGLEVLGQARRVVVTKDNTTIVDGAGDERRGRGPRQPDQGRDREHRLRLGPREAPGAPREAGRRRVRDQGRRRHRGGAEGEEAPHRGRRLRDPRRDRGGHRRRWWLRARPRRLGARRRPRPDRRRGHRRAHRAQGRRRAAALDRRERRRQRLRRRRQGPRGRRRQRLQRRHRASTATWSPRASSTRSRSPAPRWSTPPRSRACCSRPRPWSSRSPRTRTTPGGRPVTATATATDPPLRTLTRQKLSDGSALFACSAKHGSTPAATRVVHAGLVT